MFLPYNAQKSYVSFAFLLPSAAHAEAEESIKWKGANSWVSPLADRQLGDKGATDPKYGFQSRHSLEYPNHWLPQSKAPREVMTFTIILDAPSAFYKKRSAPSPKG